MGPVRRFTFVGDFIDALRAQRYDHLVIIYYRRIPPEFQAPLLEELRKHLDAGGTMAVTYTHLDEWPEFQELLGVASAEDPPAPEDVRWTTPVHPSALIAPFGSSVSPPTIWFDVGDILEPLPGGQVVGVYDTSGAPVIISTLSGQILVNGVEWDDWGQAAQVAIGQTYWLATCMPDFDKSGSLDLFDFLEFQNLFAARDPRADVDRDGRFELFDFLTFQNAFALGCRPAP
jgi:hypothetical protein